MTNCPLAAAIAKHNITLKSVFIPFSQSRNKAEKNPSLNWKVTLLANGREIVTTDYMAGSGHCPANNRKFNDKVTWQEKAARVQTMIEFEVENGFESKTQVNFSRVIYASKRSTFDHENQRNVYHKIEPDIKSVVACLITDSDVLNYRNFAEWAENYGYSADSIKDKALYDECMSTALNLRAGLSESVLNELKDAAVDY